MFASFKTIHKRNLARVKLQWLLVLILCLNGSVLLADPLLVVAIMIKNEEHSIEDTLEPLVQGGIKEFLVYDTGSTDKTLEIVEQFFKKHDHVTAIVKQEPFVDFSTSRNRALNLAKSHFPTAEFLLMPDAEWILHNVEGLLKFCCDEVKKKVKTPSYLIRVIWPQYDYYSTRVIRAKGPGHYVGKVHEVVVPYTGVKAPKEIYFERGYYEKGCAQSKERWKRDRLILEEEHRISPKDPRTLLYLAQTCACLGDLPAARKYYEMRSKIKSWHEEDYHALFKLAEVTERMEKQDEAVTIYLEAYQKRPRRAEPLIRIAQIYLNQRKYHLAYLFCLKATEIPCPEGEILFVEKYMYEFVRYDILSQCAWYINEKKVGLAALKKAIAYRPDAEYLKKNLTFYTDVGSKNAQ